MITHNLVVEFSIDPKITCETMLRSLRLLEDYHNVEFSRPFVDYTEDGPKITIKGVIVRFRMSSLKAAKDALADDIEHGYIEGFKLNDSWLDYV